MSHCVAQASLVLAILLWLLALHLTHLLHVTYFTCHLLLVHVVCLLPWE